MSRWGLLWSQLWGTGVPEVGTDLATVRQQDFATCAYVLFIEGIEYAFVTDHSPNRELEGSGIDSWIGQYEAAAGLPYTRTVLGGLKLPGSLKCQPELDVNTGMFRTGMVSFEIVDHAGVLPGLFAQEGKDAYRLGQRIAPGTSNQSVVTTRTTSFNTASSEWSAAGACYVDTETLGPSGERRWWPCIPNEANGGWGVTWVGMEHATWEDPNDAGNVDVPVNGPPTVRLSFDPLVFEGRKCALYRIYRDPTINGDTHFAWPHWGLQHDAGNLVWYGTMRDSGELVLGRDGSRHQKISCFGQESWLKQTLGTKLHSGWMRVQNTTFDLSDERRYIAVEFNRKSYNVAGSGRLVYESSSFVFQLDAQYTNPDDLVDRIQAIVHTIRDGSVSHDYDDGASSDFNVAGHKFEFKREEVLIQSASGTNQNQEVFVHLAMHESVWRFLGWDPAAQNTNGTVGQNEFEVEFTKLNSGDSFANASTNGGVSPQCPADNFWQANFSTRSRNNLSVHNNDNKQKQYLPLYQNKDVIILGYDDSLSFSLGDDRQYIPDDPLLPIGDEDVASGFPQDSSRIFLFRGTRVVGIPSSGEVYDQNGNLVEDVEAEPYYQVALVGWDSSGIHGYVEDAGLGGPSFRIIQWLKPRLFGYDFDALGGNAEWASLSSGDLKIECLPISTYAWQFSGDGDPAWAILPALLLSTGTASNSGAFPNAVYTAGDNDNLEANPLWSMGNDRAAADMGLGIPNEMVGPNIDVINAFSVIGSPIDGINSVRYAYGPDGYESYKMIQSLIQPRGCHLTLRNNRFGIQSWTLEPEDVESTIEEGDLRGTPGSPRSVIPTQDLRALGQIDGVLVSARKMIDDPGEQYSLSREIFQRAKDPSAHLRAGDRIVKVEEHGYIGGESDFRLFWAHELAEFFAKRHFAVRKLRVSRQKGQDLYVGSRIRLTNPWVFDTAGNEGVTGSFGIVIGVSLDTKDEVYLVDCLIYAGQFGDGPRVFMPIGKIASISGTTVTLEDDADWLDHGEGSDAGGFAAATWMSGGAATVRILSWDRNTWTLNSETATVSSVNTGANTVTLSGAFSSTPNPNHVQWLVCTDYDGQGSTSWARNHGIPISLATGTFGSGTAAIKYQDK